MSRRHPNYKNQLDDIPTPITDADQTELFSEELEDRYNAKMGSTASSFACVGSSFSSGSSACSVY